MSVSFQAFNFTRSIGQTFGVALGGTIFQNHWNKNVASLIMENSFPLAFQIDGRQADGAALLLLDLPPAVRAVVKQLYTDSLRGVRIFFMPLAVISFFLSLFARNLSLDKALNSKQAFVEKKRSLEEESQLDAFRY